LRLADVSDLVVLGGARIEGPAQEELGDDAAQRPHVDGLAEGQAQDDLGRAIVAALQVRVAHRLAHVRRAPEVDHFDSVRLPLRIHQHDVLGFQVRVNQPKLLKNSKHRQRNVRPTLLSHKYDLT